MTENSPERPPDKSNVYLVHIFTSVIAGWNLFIAVAFTVLLGLSTLVNMMLGSLQGGGTIFWICAAIAMVAGIAAGYYGARRLHRYFSRFQVVGSYVWLTVMLYLAMTTFPTRFFYMA